MAELGLVGRDEITTAAAEIDGIVRRTPIIEGGPGFYDGAGNVVAKLELLQHTGSFKPRGALYRALTSEIPDTGLIAASGGNHGLAVAWVGRHLGVPAEIFVPTVSPPAKVAKLHELGATVNVVGALYADALAACRERQLVTGALDIHAYDHRDTIAGAGTIAREIEIDLPGIDTIVVAVGGGGLASGIAAWCGTDTKVVAVEPETSCCYAAAIDVGEPVDVTVSGVAADSLGAPRIGESNWAALCAAGARPVRVADAAIRAAQRRLWNTMRLVVEPGGATAMAAIWSGGYVPDVDERVCVIVCGANCDPADVVGA